MAQFSLMDQATSARIAQLESRQLQFIIGYMWSRISCLSSTAVADHVAQTALAFAPPPAPQSLPIEAALRQAVGVLPDGQSPVKGAEAEGPHP